MSWPARSLFYFDNILHLKDINAFTFICQRKFFESYERKWIIEIVEANLAFVSAIQCYSDSEQLRCSTHDTPA